MIRLFATDLDDTLLNAEKQIDQHNLDALEKLQQSGVHVAVASGRNEVEIEQVVHNLPGDFHRVCQNGAFIYLNSEEKIYEGYFETELAKKIYQVGKDAGMYCFIGTARTMYIPEKNHFIERKSKQVAINLEYDPSIENRIGTDVIPSKFCYLGDGPELQQLKQLLLKTFPGQIDVFVSAPHCLDVMPLGVNKGNGLRHLADHLGFDLSEVACIGDSENDIPMFRVVPHSFVMSVAKPSVQKEARRQVSSVSEAVEWVITYNENLALQQK
ncbi:HAD family hydrolase [Shimazuella sp. AN120528]|uniref:HAD family hydrolase n=1 Tax=Shimazuella soli TaxID=1892854 RepID=UPI001F10B176|nr:HAD family hydrolase [Shimazuella soli]MCH5586519.1 HAD family hydrolase [Shimazuella soli]